MSSSSVIVESVGCSPSPDVSESALVTSSGATASDVLSVMAESVVVAPESAPAPVSSTLLLTASSSTTVVISAPGPMVV